MNRSNLYFYAITSGVDGLCKPQTGDMTIKVKNASTEKLH